VVGRSACIAADSEAGSSNLEARASFTTMQAFSQSPQPATRVLREGEMNGGYYYKLDNGVLRQRGEGPCREFIGVCRHEDGYQVYCSDCAKLAECR
jgi:hypothetical protein